MRSSAEAVPADFRPEELVERIRRGDRQAESELVARYRRGVLALLRNASRDSSTTEDLGQETFRIAIEKIRAGDVREPAKIAGFVAAIARNLAVEHYRKLAAQRVSGSAEDLAIASPERSPLEDLLLAERAAVVRGVLAEMPSPRDHQILARFYLEEDGKDEICRDLGLTALHFNRVLFRARTRYRELYSRRSEKLRRGAR